MLPLHTDEVSNPPTEPDPAVIKLAAVRLQVQLSKLGGSFTSIDDRTAIEMAVVIANLLGPKEGTLE